LFNYSIQNCIIKFNDSNTSFEGVAEVDFANNINYSSIILNGNPNFRDTQNNDFTIGTESDAINKAFTTPFNTDLLGMDRTTNPDIGAYQHITF